MRPYDSDEEADRHAGLRTRALPVADGRTDGAFDDDAPPANGLEYLARVRREAATVPDVMVADAAARRAHASDALGAATDTTRAARLGEADALQTAPDAVTRKRFAASAPVLAAAAAAPASAPRHARRAGVAPGVPGVVLGRPRGRRQARRQAPRGPGDFGDVGDFGDAPGDARRGGGPSRPRPRTPRAALAAAAALEDGAAVSAPLPSLSLVADADEVSTAEALREHARAIEARFFHPPGIYGRGRPRGRTRGRTRDDPGTTARRFLRFGRLVFRAGVARDVRSTPTRGGDARRGAGVRGGARGDGSEHDPSLPDLQVGLPSRGYGQEEPSSQESALA